MRYLIFGRSGQVAQELARRLPPQATAKFLDRSIVDLADPEACEMMIATSNVTAVINAAAWTAVDRAEAEESAANLINAEAPAAMARAAERKGVPFLHLSTDYVFGGEGDHFHRPEDPTGPLQAYGRSKLAGEVGVRAAGGRSLILRTSWVFSAHGSNFVKTMLRLGAEREVLRVVDDQHGGPTPAAAIADALFVAATAMVKGGHSGGTYHFAGAPQTSWAGLASAVMAEAGLRCRIEGITSADYPTPARRPLNSRLDCSSWEADFGMPRPDWITHLRDVVTEVGVRA